jgi:FkbM family methyltransferase|tara:strand:+ start:6158 stop:7000 length:843 start_codon:yes stop_codon:yes gene_type:complete
MKKILKIILKKFAKCFIAILNTNKIGRYFNEYLSKYIFDQKKVVKHNSVKLVFYSPNRINRFRIETFSSKEPETLRWIENFEENGVLWDIGANIGLYTCYAAKLKNTSVYAFEPSVFNIELLTKNVFINKLSKKVTIVPLPLVDKIKESEFNMTSKDIGGSSSTFDKDYTYDGSKLKREFHYKMLGVTMNDCVNVLKIKQPDYIKIDVDGIEHLILEGGNQILKKIKGIIVEVDEKFLIQSEKTKKYLSEAGLVQKEKKHSDIIEKSKFKNVYNQIWERI